MGSEEVVAVAIWTSSGVVSGSGDVPEGELWMVAIAGRNEVPRY